MTETPLQNNLHELWAYSISYCPAEVVKNKSSSVGSRQDRCWWSSCIGYGPFMIRRLGTGGEKDLPRKRRCPFLILAPIQQDVRKQCLLREISTVQGSAAQKARGPLLQHAAPEVLQPPLLVSSRGIGLPASGNTWLMLVGS